MSGRDSIFIEASARLHFGVLDLRGALGRRFGGLGAAVPQPSLLLEAAPASKLSAEGEDADRATEFARRFLRHHGLSGGARLRIHRAIPAHSGLGSGTQLGLAVARALSEVYGTPAAADPAELARAVSRGERSAIGTWTFARGGFIVEGGRRVGAHEIAPLLVRLPMPAAWRCVVAVPRGEPGLSGDAESAAFRRLPLPHEGEVERVSHIVLMQLLPALVEHDLPAFGSALTAVQRITGAWFAPEQGGIFAPGPTAMLVARMSEWGAAGVGQSSWGPAVYGLVDSESASAKLASRVRELLGGDGRVFEGAFANSGARLWRAETASIRD
jgi:beta-ribofuranosylaminobenzene 5'-phosphate synthase